MNAAMNTGKVTLNPELRRYCWLELTPHRLIAAPVIAGLILALVAAVSNQSPAALASAGLAGFAVCVLLYGSYLAVNAMPEEVRERTWDAQRMSALTPWQLAFGKVLGAPVAGWYAGAWFLAVFLVAGIRTEGVDALLIAGTAVSAALSLHAVAMILGVFATRAGVTRNPGALLLLLIFWFALVPLQTLGESNAAPILWWGAQVPRLWFTLASALLFAAWGSLGAVRTFAGELRVRQLPWAWPAFSLYVGVWAGGLADAPASRAADAVQGVLQAGAAANPAVVVLLIFFLCTGLGAYVLLLAERTGAMTLARVLRTLRGELAGGVRRALQSVPLWSVSLVCAWLSAAALLVLPWGTGLNSLASAVLNDISAAGKLMPLALAAMLLRDAGIYCIFALTRFPRRPAMATMLYLVLLDGVVPVLMNATGLSTIAFLVFPLGRASAAGALVIFLLQAAVAWGFALKRWRDGQRLDLST